LVGQERGGSSRRRHGAMHSGLGRGACCHEYRLLMRMVERRSAACALRPRARALEPLPSRAQLLRLAAFALASPSRRSSFCTSCLWTTCSRLLLELHSLLARASPDSPVLAPVRHPLGLCSPPLALALGSSTRLPWRSPTWLPGCRASAAAAFQARHERRRRSLHSRSARSRCVLLSLISLVSSR